MTTTTSKWGQCGVRSWDGPGAQSVPTRAARHHGPEDAYYPYVGTVGTKPQKRISCVRRTAVVEKRPYLGCSLFGARPHATHTRKDLP